MRSFKITTLPVLPRCARRDLSGATDRRVGASLQSGVLGAIMAGYATTLAAVISRH